MVGIWSVLIVRVVVFCSLTLGASKIYWSLSCLNYIWSSHRNSILMFHHVRTREKTNIGLSDATICQRYLRLLSPMMIPYLVIQELVIVVAVVTQLPFQLLYRVVKKLNYTMELSTGIYTVPLSLLKPSCISKTSNVTLSLESLEPLRNFEWELQWSAAATK